MAARKRQALVIAHEPDGGGAQIAQRLSERGFDVETHVVTRDYANPLEAAAFPDLTPYDLLVPMGSIRSMTRTDEISSWIHAEADLVREAHQRGVPVLGICFGGQLIAAALGGAVEPSPITEIGWFDLDPADGATNPAGPGPWMEWHHDRFTVPPGAEVLAVTDAGPQLFVIDKTVGTQFHPEVTVAHIRGWLSNVSDEYLAEHGVDRSGILEATQRNEAAAIERCRAFVDWFLDEVAFPGEDIDR